MERGCSRSVFFPSLQWLSKLNVISPDAFQLITWSKDRTLRFWPIDFEVMQVCSPHILSYLDRFSFSIRKLATFHK